MPRPDQGRSWNRTFPLLLPLGWEARQVANSYFEMEADRATESWRTVRAFRARPPKVFTRTLKGRRGSVFHAGLEQAQQQFSAAAAVGYESRPLNLFYGLAQAGRAIAAISPRLRGEAAWEGDQHGLHFSTGYGENLGFLNAPIDVRPSGHDLFSRVSLAVGAGSAEGAVTLNELLSCLPELNSRYGPFQDYPAARLSQGSGYGNPFAMGPPHEVGLLTGLTHDGNLLPEQAELVWSAYPALAGLPRPRRRLDDPDLVQVTGTPGQVHVDVNRVEDAVLHHGTWHPAGSVIYRGKRWLLPFIGTPRFAPQPLTVWWLILYACSVMSRYDASRWTKLLELRHDSNASLVEHVLDLALDAVPDVIAAALHSLNQIH